VGRLRLTISGIPNWNLARGGFIAIAAAALLLLAPAAGVHPLRAQSDAVNNTGITVEANQQIFATMCALDAAGYDADESTLADMPERLKLRGDLLRLHGAATEALRQFYHDHRLADPGETLSRYITFGLVIGPPPQFQYTLDHDMLPPDVISIENFQPILANFYREAGLRSRWSRVEPEYEDAVGRYGSIVRRVVTSTNSYMREILRPSTGRTFSVFVEPLVGERANFRNYGDHYAIVVGAIEPLPEADIQHAYLHFMLDPLPLKYRNELQAKSAIFNVAARAPELPAEYHTDFISFADECLIKAVELRLRHLPAEKEEAVLKEDDAAGFVMVRTFAHLLLKFEKSEPSLTYYFPDLVVGIDVPAELKRVQAIAFAKPQAPAAEEAKAAPAEPQSETDQLLAEGDRQIALQNPGGAAEAFEKVLKLDPVQPKALYGLAVARLMSRQGDKAMDLFQAIVSPPPEASKEPADPATLAWSHIYLGRLYDLEDERDEAMTHYRAALAVQGAPEAARVAAQRGIDGPYKSQAPRGSGSQ
jgi:tetratricopeptide (TPR) repeat protein